MISEHKENRDADDGRANRLSTVIETHHEDDNEY
jgi:hypothetical protein